MATLINGVNEVLKRLSIVSSTNPLTSLNNSGKQVFIDLVVQAWNETVDQLYSKSLVLKPFQGAESKIVLIEGKRHYDLETDLIQVRWPMHEEQKGFYLDEYKGGYEQLRNIQTQPDNFKGQPFFAAISPIEKQIYIDRVPTLDVVGYTYVYFYWRDTVLEREADLFPFDDGVFRALVPAVSETYKMMKKSTGSSTKARVQSSIMKTSFGRALRMVNQTQADRTYVKRFGVRNQGPLGQDPFRE